MPASARKDSARKTAAESVSARPVRPATSTPRATSVTRWGPKRAARAGETAPTVEKASTGSVVSSPAPAPPRPNAVDTSSRTGPTLTAAGRRFSATSTMALTTSAPPTVRSAARGRVWVTRGSSPDRTTANRR